jgi:D-3-phosphoglycerate dehydrogenase
MEILITEPDGFSREGLDLLNTLGNVSLGPMTRKGLLEKIKNVEVLFVRLSHLIDEEVIKSAPNLKYILTATTGLNHIDTNFLKTTSINVISLKGEEAFLSSIPSTAEHTWALLMALVRKIPSAFDSVKENIWDRNQFKSHNLNSLTLGIFGYGRVGKQVAQIAQAFQMNVMIYDIKKIKTQDFILAESAEDLFSNSDIVSIHLDYSESNENIVNKSLLQKLNKGSYLINTSRGELLQEEDVIFYLENKTLAGLAVDVLKNETSTRERNSNPLLNYAKNNNNVIITPHIAGATFESMEMTENFIIQKFRSFL